MITDELRALLVSEVEKVGDLQTLLAGMGRPGKWFLLNDKPLRDRAGKLVEDSLAPDEWVRDLVAQLVKMQPENEQLHRIAYALEHDVVDRASFPFHLPLAQQLVRVMATLYTDLEDALALVASAAPAIEPLEIRRDRSPLQLWRDLLREAGNVRSMRAVAKAALVANPNSVHAAFLTALLAQEPTPVNASLGDGKFLVGTQAVTRNEALLFHDNLMLPVGRVPALVESIRGVLAKANAVCSLEVTNANGDVAAGTGFRIGGDLVLTNEHVLAPFGAKAIDVKVRFELQVGTETKIERRTGTVSTIKTNTRNDWGVIVVPDMDPAWPAIDLTQNRTPAPGDLAFIVQHPGGHDKRLAFVRNTITNVDTRVVHYLTDTEEGASGAPVFDQTGAIVALHRRGGEPQIRAGKPPIIKNEGVRISVVHDELAKLLQPGL